MVLLRFADQMNFLVLGLAATMARILRACAAPLPLILLSAMCGGCLQTRGAPAPAAVQTGSDTTAAAHMWRVRRGGLIERTWGIEVEGVRLTASEWMIEFKYRVTDSAKARGLLSHNAKPYLADQLSGAKLAVPAMENDGELRQAAEPEVGRDYFILFGNANKIVRRGNLVDIEIGAFRAEGLPVE